MPIFSVIVPVYKVEAYLPQCIESVLKQTFTDFELILVDDGSPDGCGMMCDEYAAKDSRIHVVHKENGGVTSARQAGADVAIGEYIACVDADDWIHPKYLQSFYDVIKEYQCDIVTCGYFISNQNELSRVSGKFSTGLYKREKIENEIFPSLIYAEDGRAFSASLWAKVFRRSLFRKTHSGLDIKITFGEDGAVSKACVWHSNSIYIIADCLYYYRKHQQSVVESTKVYDLNTICEIALYLENQIDMKQFGFQAQLYRRVVHDLFNTSASQFNRKEPYALVVRDIKKQLKNLYYKNAIAACRFKNNCKGSIAKFSLKYKLYVIMWLYNRLK